ncbi:MAG: hypothetical protein ACYS22_21035, partial [Planctomycetota bacterium]
ADPGAEARVPALAMLSATPDSLRARTEALRSVVEGADPLAFDVVPSEAAAGSGALPAQPIPSLALAVSHPARNASELADALRAYDPPIFTRVVDERVQIELRTVLPEHDVLVAEALRSLA